MLTQRRAGGAEEVQAIKGLKHTKYTWDPAYKGELSKLCEDMGIPYAGGTRLSVGDVFRSATGDIRERVPVTAMGETNIIDDEKQRSKMTGEFDAAVKKEIATYQERADYFIKSGSQSPAVMDRWVLKIQALEEKKKHYEGVLRRELDGLDDEFSTLKFLAQELKVRAQGIRGRKAA